MHFLKKKKATKLSEKIFLIYEFERNINLNNPHTENLGIFSPALASMAKYIGILTDYKCSKLCQIYHIPIISLSYNAQRKIIIELQSNLIEHKHIQRKIFS